MPLLIIRQDITKIECDAIVNPTDCLYSGGGGTDLAVHKAAGDELDLECSIKPMLNIADVTVTSAYALPCRYILHTFGPLWIDGECNEENLLRACYMNSLIQAKKLNVDSIAMPLISAGTFGFPKDKVLKIALNAISDFLSLVDRDMFVYLCVFDKKAYEISEKYELDKFLQKNTVRAEGAVARASIAPPFAVKSEKRAALKEKATFLDDVLINENAKCEPLPAPCSFAIDDIELKDWIKQQDETFAVTLLKLIDRKEMTDSECYKKANVSKQTFWKICNEPKYRPSKATVLAFAISLELDYEETQQLLKTVGYSLSHSNTFDMIIEFYIRKGIYDIFEINGALYQYDQICLGA